MFKGTTVHYCSVSNVTCRRNGMGKTYIFEQCVVTPGLCNIIFGHLRICTYKHN